MKNHFTLSKKEKELMELFWDAGCPLARAEILERAENRECSWKPNSVHILVNSLLDKGALKVSGFYLNSRKLGRTFEPAVSHAEYAFMQVEQAASQARTEVGMGASNLVAALFDDEADLETLNEMAAVIRDKKKEITNRDK